MTRALTTVALSFLTLWCNALARQARAEEVPDLYHGSIDKGLTYLAKTQYPDGHWEANGGMYPTSITALAGMAFLMEGSTIRDGRYSTQIRKAVDWFMERGQKNGLIGNPRNPAERSHYIHGHGYALLFLSQVYGEEEDGDRRRKLERILTKAVEFSGKAQSSRGGWWYTSAADSGDADEGSTTITQMQGLRAARNAGIVVPKGIMDRGMDYLKKCTTPQGGVIYRLGDRSGERPPLTAAAVACSFSAGDYNSALVKKWLRFSQKAIPLNGAGDGFYGHWEYTHYYYAQSLYFLGEKGYAKMFPASKESERLTWSKYRENVFPYIVSRQAMDGSWNLSNVGPVYSTACCLAIMQLDHAALPIYQR